jgi:hypothetical protein
LWPLLQIFPHLGQFLFPFCRFAALPALRVDSANRRVQSELRRFEKAAARGDIRVLPQFERGPELLR